MNQISRTALVAVALAGFSALAEAQTTGYIQVTPLVIAQPTGTPATHRTRPGIGGTVIGGSLAAGVRIVKGLSIEVEGTTQRSVFTTQRFTYTWTEDWTSEFRDRFLVANLRLQTAIPHLEFFGGGGITSTYLAKRSRVEIRTFPASVTNLPDTEEGAHHATLGGGVAFPFTVGRVVSIVPTASMRWVERGGLNGDGGEGAPARVYHLGVSLRFGPK